MKRFIPISLFLLLSCAAVSCYDCGPKAEPYIFLSVSSASSPLQRIRAVGARSDSAFDAFILPNSYRQLPLSLLQDSTTYLFYFSDRVDTLTLFYKRIFDTRGECGYYLDIVAPDGPRFHSTFLKTEVYYSPYTGKNKGLAGSGAYGISVRLER